MPTPPEPAQMQTRFPPGSRSMPHQTSSARLSARTERDVELGLEQERQRLAGRRPSSRRRELLALGCARGGTRTAPPAAPPAPAPSRSLSRLARSARPPPPRSARGRARSYDASMAIPIGRRARLQVGRLVDRHLLGGGDDAHPGRVVVGDEGVDPPAWWCIGPTLAMSAKVPGVCRKPIPWPVAGASTITRS